MESFFQSRGVENSATNKQFFLKVISITAAKANRAVPVRGARNCPE